MGKIIAVVSGKGGTGKTTTVAALGSCLAAMGYKTLCVDCDAGLRNLDLSLGMVDYGIYDFGDVISGDRTLDDACVAHPKIGNLYYLAAPAHITVQEFAEDSLLPLAEQAREKFDFCFLDAAAGIDSGFHMVAAAADSAIIVTTVDAAGIRDAQRVMQELSAMKKTDVRLLVNRVTRAKFRQSDSNVDDIIDTVGAQLIGVVFEDSAVFRATSSDTPLVLYESKNAAVCFLDTALRLADTGDISVAE